MNSLIEFDQQMLLVLNYFHSAYWDIAQWLISGIAIWIPMYTMIVYTIIKSQKLQSWLTVLTVIILIVLCDLISTEVFKHGIERLRPTHTPDIKDFIKTVRGYKGGKYGFVSSHATNTMGLAVFTSLLFRNKFYSLFIIAWSLIVGYSRIYLGVHFPGDVLGGFVLGSILGFTVYKIYTLIIPRFVRLTFFNKKGLKRGIAEQFESKLVFQILFTGILTFILILISANLLK